MTKLPKIDWLNHALEFFVVLIGILIAFQLDKCSDNNRQEKLVRNHLVELQQESEENVLRINKGINHTNQQLQKADSLLKLIVDRGNVFVIKRLSTEILDLRAVPVKKDAYTVMAASGDLRFLSRYEDKRSTILLYEQYSNIARVDENTQKIYDNYYYPYLKNNFDLVNWNLDPSDLQETDSYYSKEFGNIVSTYRYLLNAKLNTYKTTLEEVQQYLGHSDQKTGLN